VIALLGLGLLFAPQLIPWLGNLAGRMLRRPIVVGRIPHMAIWVAALISAASWVVYGVAFRVMAVGVLGGATGAVGTYIAVFTASYLAGFLALIAPGGVGVREIVMFAGLRQAGFTGGEATLLVVSSRVWLTILEIVPAVLFLAHRWVRPRRSDGPIESTR
jgi:glycosyltransferase 2 family protein